MSYRNGLTKTKYKNKMRMFWTHRWYYERTIQDWTDLVHGSMWSSKTILSRQQCIELLFDAVEKLILEKKLTKEHAENVKAMLRSPDPESTYVGISIMASLKPKKFKRERNVAQLSRIQINPGTVARDPQ